MQGATLSAAWLGASGIPGDRSFALRDHEVGSIQGARRHGKLLTCRARILDELTPGMRTTGSERILAEIEFPDGSRMLTEDPLLDAALSELLGQAVSLHSLDSTLERRHYRRAMMTPRQAVAELRRIMDIRKGDKFPKLHRLPPSLLLNETLPGTYFDAAPILLLSQQSLDSLGKELPDADLSVRRFRPNLLIDVPDSPGRAPEQRWLGKKVRVGEAVLKVTSNCPRCVMTTRAFDDLPQDRRVLRTIADSFNRNFGVYAKVISPGTVRDGDPVEIL